MDDKHLAALLDTAKATKDGDWSVVGDERKITLHAAFGGVGLNIGRVTRLRVADELLHVENDHGEVFIVALSDVFAGSVAAEKKAGRKAGFV